MGKSNSKTKKKTNKTVKSKSRNLGFWIELAGNIFAWAAILVYFIVVPCYFKNGYERIATYKYICLMDISRYAAIILVAYVLVHFALWGMSKEERQAYKPLLTIDLGMLVFLFGAFCSHLCSEYKVVGSPDDFWFYEGSLYGASGWYIGFVTYLVVVALYFFVSRYFKYSHYIWIPIMAVTLALFVWGNLNRYEIYPVEMEYANPSFIASFGNINWFAGFVSIMVPLLTGLYWGSKRVWLRWALVPVLIIFDATILLNGSDSLVAGYFIVLFTLLLVSLKHEKGLSHFSEVLMIFAFSAFVISVIDLYFPGLRSAGTVLGDILISPMISLLLLAFGLVIKAYTLLVIQGKTAYPKWMAKILPLVLLILAGASVVIFIVLLVVNTVTGGKVPIIGGSAWFKFGPLWASKRGATWTSGWLVFKDLPLGKKLIGVGPDMLYYALRDNPTALEYATEAFGEARLTNSHNEILTLLVNVGLLGAGSFVFMCVSAIKAFIKGTFKKPVSISFALAMIGYLGNNIFSFEQITNLPFFMLTVGIGAAFLVKLNKEKTLELAFLLTKNTQKNTIQ